MKCMFGCKNYGKWGACSPDVPSVPESEAFFKRYKTGVVFHFTQKVDRPEDRSERPNKVVIARNGVTKQSHEIASLRSQ